MRTEILEGCYYELIEEIEYLKNQIKEIDLKIADKRKEIDGARDVVGSLANRIGELIDSKAKLTSRINSLSRAVEMLKCEVE